MQDYYLKFPDKATADAILFEQVSVSDTETRSRNRYQNTDVIGIIYEGGEWDAEGNTITPPVALEGWHVNIRLMGTEDATPLDAFKVMPTHPRRMWA